MTASTRTPAIDAHVHLLDPARFSYGWPPDGRGHVAGPWLVDDIRGSMADRAIASLVVVQAQDADAETDWLLDLADAEPAVAAVVGWVDLCAAPDAVADRLRELVGRGLRGIRHRVALEADDRWLMSESVGRGLNAVAEARLPFELLLVEAQLPQVQELSNRHPDLDLVLDHLGLPMYTAESFDRWRRDLRAAAANPRLTCKLSGIMREGKLAADPGLVRAHIEAALEAFGPERAMFGTDWPISTDGGPYGPAVDAEVEMLAHLPADAFDAIFHLTARRVYALSSSTLGDGPSTSG